MKNPLKHQAMEQIPANATHGNAVGNRRSNWTPTFHPDWKDNAHILSPAATYQDKCKQVHNKARDVYVISAYLYIVIICIITEYIPFNIGV